MIKWLAAVTLLVGACDKTAGNAGGAGGSAAPAAAYLTVDAYCSAFCTKLCGTCGGPGSTCDPCKPRCYHGRAPDSLLDGKDPKIALALTQSNLDGCLAGITKDSCMTIASGNVPPVCYTIQH